MIADALILKCKSLRDRWLRQIDISPSADLVAYWRRAAAQRANDCRAKMTDLELRLQRVQNLPVSLRQSAKLERLQMRYAVARERLERLRQRIRQLRSIEIRYN